MDSVSGYSSQGYQCTEAVVDAGMAGSACLTAIVGTAATSPTGVGLVVGGISILATCVGTGLYGTKAYDMCSSDGEPSGMAPHGGSDGMDDHRNDPANAAWRSGVVIEPLASNEATEDSEFEFRDSSY